MIIQRDLNDLVRDLICQKGVNLCKWSPNHRIIFRVFNTTRCTIQLDLINKLPVFSLLILIGISFKNSNFILRLYRDIIVIVALLRCLSHTEIVFHQTFSLGNILHVESSDSQSGYMAPRYNKMSFKYLTQAFFSHQ